MFWEDTDPHLTGEEVADFFDEVPEETVNIFTYQKRDGTLLGIKDFFKAFYYKRISRFRKSEIAIAKSQFHLIFSDNIFIIEKIKKEMEVLRELTNIEKNWKNVVHSDTDMDYTTDDLQSQNTTDSSTNTKDLISGTLRGSVDMAQFSEVKKENLLTASDSKIMGYLDPNTRSKEHQIHRDAGTDTVKSEGTQNITSKNKHKNKGFTITSSSNASDDYRNFMNLRLPEIRREFLEKFGIIFFT